MTKKQYMTALKNNIQSLTLDEQKEALQYYEDYFEEAGDDKKVMEEAKRASYPSHTSTLF